MKKLENLKKEKKRKNQPFKSQLYKNRQARNLSNSTKVYNSKESGKTGILRLLGNESNKQT